MLEGIFAMAEVVQAETRKLAAIMFTDIVDFSRQMGADEKRMLRLLDVHNQLIRQVVTEHHGTVIKTVGDAFLVDFPSVVHAVQCGQQILAALRNHNTEQESAEQIHVRIGIHLGDVVQKDDDVFGDGVNIASRLQGLAEPDTICISQKVYEEVAKKLELGTVVSLGRPKLKNITDRFQVYALLPQEPKGLRQRLQVQHLKLSRRIRQVHWLSIAGLSLIAGTLLTVHYLPFLQLLLFPPHPLAPNTEATLPPLLLPDKPSIVILPFTNMSNDPSQDYFIDGITEDITSDLSKISSLFVISRNSAFSYKGKSPKVQDVSREMGVRYVLEGSVRKAGDQVRITAQLIDAATGGHLWSERYDRPLQDIFALQDEIRQKIVLALKVKLTSEERRRFRQAPTANLEAYDFYLRGQEFFSRAYYESKMELNGQAQQMYEKAIALDPQYAGAYARLSRSYFWDWLRRWSADSAQSLDRAFTLAQKAVALDDALPLAHQVLGQVYVWRKEYDQAIVEAERAVVLDPNEAEGYVNLGNILAFAERTEEAITVTEKAIRLNPHYPPVYLFGLGFIYRVAGRYEEAITTLKRVLPLMANNLPIHINLAACYVELGRLEEAQAEAAEILRLNPHFSLELAKKQNWPYKDPADFERYLAALRKAGLK